MDRSAASSARGEIRIMSTVTLSPVELEVLNSAADDAENLEQVYKLCQHATSPITLTEIAESVRCRIEKGLLAPRADENGRPISQVGDPSLIWRAWFEMTPLGREAWASSSRGTTSDPLPPRASRFGAWKDIAVGVPVDVFQENRREMWRASDGDARG
jgi:hypothetical protein